MQRALATVDLSAVRNNVTGLIARLSRGTNLMAVVKAGGYGHGAVEVARASLESGAAALGVATLAEAQELREAGIEGRIIVLGPLAGRELAQAFSLRVELLAWSLPFLKNLVLSGHAAGARMPIHVKVDTGMHRLGLNPKQLPDFLDAIETEPEVELTGVMTHFATADEGDDFFHYQLRSFDEAVQVVLRTGTKVQFHCANSAAAIRFPEAHFDMVRCGISIYGLSPFQGEPEADGLTPALRLTSFICDIKQVSEGDSVGYGRTWTARRSTHIGMVPIGYGDGFSRRLSSRGRVLAGGRSHDIVGRISMDLITVDLGPILKVQNGDEVVLIGSQQGERITAEEIAMTLDTINYEVTCNLSRRVERRFSA